MKTFTITVPGQHDVTVTKLAREYRVTYGLEIRGRLDYDCACRELGRSIMHALGCNGFHDGE